MEKKNVQKLAGIVLILIPLLGWFVSWNACTPDCVVLPFWTAVGVISAGAGCVLVVLGFKKEKQG